MQQTTIAIDLAKSIFEVGISDRPGHVCEQHRLSRNQLQLFLANQPPSTILMEACSSSHHWARQCRRFGHDVKLAISSGICWLLSLTFMNPRDVD
jgi:transposase